MSIYTNRVQLKGNLAADPDIRHTHTGKPIANLRVATTETWKDNTTGEKREKTEFHTVVVFNEHMAKFAESLRKGMKVSVEGKLQTRKWTDQSGQDRYTTEVVVQSFEHSLDALASPNGRHGGQQQGGGGYGQGGAYDHPHSPGTGGSGYSSGGGGATRGKAQGDAGGSFDKDLDDEIPF